MGLPLASEQNEKAIVTWLEVRSKQYRKGQSAMTELVRDLVKDKHELGEEFYTRLEMLADVVGASPQTLDDYVSCISAAQTAMDGPWYFEELELAHHREVWYREFTSEQKRKMLQLALDNKWEPGVLRKYVHAVRHEAQVVSEPNGKAGNETGGSVAITKSDRVKARLAKLESLLRQSADTIKFLAPDDQATDLLDEIDAALEESW